MTQTPTLPTIDTPTPDGDAQALAFALRRAIDGEVRFDPGSRHLYATDASNYRQIPVGVVVPRTVDDIVATVRICREHGVPITHRGGGTSLAGQSCNAAVIIDSSKYLRNILDIDPDARTATVETGLVLDSLRTTTQAEHRLTWGPDPSTHNRCTVGGMIGNNSCGIHAFEYGRVEDNVEELEILLYDGTRMTVGPTSEDELTQIIADGGRKGEIYAALKDLRDRYADQIRERFPDIPRRVSGYNLTELLPENGFNVARALVGTEGTCVTILNATVNLNHYYPQRALLVLGYPSVYEAGDHIGELRESSAIALEGLDAHLIHNIAEKGLHSDALRYLPEGDGWLLVEFGGDTRDEAQTQARELMERLKQADNPPTMHLYDDERDEAKVWQAREAGLGATAHFEGRDAWPGWEDSAVAPEDVGDYLRDLRDLFDEYGYDASLYGHFGDGCIHCRISFDLTTADGVARYRDFLYQAADLVHGYGGSLSGEHGDGQQRGELLEVMFGEDLVQAMREFKAIWDPDNRMNPGKVVDPYKLDEHLRLGADHRQWHPETTFAYPDDDFDFNRAALRCVGVGKCRRDDGGGTMCPSYMVTHEEKHSTRGRARLLFEMLQPDSELDGWKDEHVKEALDLCLSCKGCTTDCPVNVDMPTYKAEFLHHYYEGRVHPRVHYAMGLINVWSRIASVMPGIANWALNAPGLGRVLKQAAGVAADRPAPKYAEQTFREWFEARPARNQDKPRVLLFPDTFVNYFQPEIGKDTVAVLEDAGYQVTMPTRPICCGRPLYDYGFLDLADYYLEQLVDTLSDEVAAGTKIVGMEPSCLAVFRDELVQMRPHDADANRISENTYSLAEFLVEVADYEFPHLERRAVVQGHCHHKGALGMGTDEDAWERLGLDAMELDAGCCGLAGSFGFEAGEKFDVSVKAGERKLMPAVRETEDDTLIMADGFSCRTQIRHLQQMGVDGSPVDTDANGAPRRQALHLAQVIQMAKQEGPVGPTLDHLPERDWLGDDTARFTSKDTRVLAIAGAVAAAGVGALSLWRRMRG